MGPPKELVDCNTRDSAEFVEVEVKEAEEEDVVEVGRGTN